MNRIRSLIVIGVFMLALAVLAATHLVKEDIILDRGQMVTGMMNKKPLPHLQKPEEFQALKEKQGIDSQVLPSSQDIGASKTEIKTGNLLASAEQPLRSSRSLTTLPPLPLPDITVLAPVVPNAGKALLAENQKEAQRASSDDVKEAPKATSAEPSLEKAFKEQKEQEKPVPQAVQQKIQTPQTAQISQKSTQETTVPSQEVKPEKAEKSDNKAKSIPTQALVPNGASTGTQSTPEKKIIEKKAPDPAISAKKETTPVAKKEVATPQLVAPKKEMPKNEPPKKELAQKKDITVVKKEEPTKQEQKKKEEETKPLVVNTSGPSKLFKSQKAITQTHLELGKAVVFRVSGAENLVAKTMMLSKPDRYVVDLQGNWGIQLPKVPNNPLLNNIRTGQQQTATRLVFELKRKPQSAQIVKINAKTLEVRIK